MKKCINCGSKNADTAKHCHFCNTELPELQREEKRETSYVHDSSTEQKKAKNRKILFAVVSVLVICILAGLLSVIFSEDKITKSQQTLSMIIDVIKEEKTVSGTVQTQKGTKDFSLSFKKDAWVFTIGTETKLTFTQTGMFSEKEGVVEEITKNRKEYPLFTAYKTLFEMAQSEKNPLAFDTKDIEKVFIPPIKELLGDEFNETFIENNFVSGISSILMTFESTPDLQTNLSITLPNDVKNAEIAFEVSSYSLQNSALGKLKKAFKNQSDYDEINQRLKEEKSFVKNSYGAKGTFKTSQGKLVSAETTLTYDGYACKVNFTVE